VLILTPEEAVAGMRLAAPVPHPEQPGREMLRAGYVLEAAVIARLRAMGVAYLYVDFPDLDDLDRQLAPLLSPQRQALYAKMKQTIESCQRRTRPAVAYFEYYNATRALITTLLCQGPHPLYLDMMARCGEDDEVDHGTAVAHLALLLGIKLQEYLIEQRPRLAPQLARDTVNLGVAAMLHDLGKFQLPEALWRCSEVNPPATREQLYCWQSHPRIGHELLRESVEPTAAAAVLQHHQHFDGGGFPAVASGAGQARTMHREEIHVFARIIYAADLFDRLSNPQRGARRSNLQVLHQMRTRFATQVDPTVMRALVAIAPPFPPGSKLRLSDGTNAVVLRSEQGNPYRPLVRRTIGQEPRFDGQPIDLSSTDALSIESASGVSTAGLVPA
jgi:HD-GYP domain-containing protein (c-di-GMP phosphodiesterase class II)